MMHSVSIKNLCIALEALSRIPDSCMLSSRIRDLLEGLLKEEEETKTEKPETPNPTPNLDDEIPF